MKVPITDQMVMDRKKILEDQISEESKKFAHSDANETKDLVLTITRLSAQIGILEELLSAERPPTGEEKNRGYKG